MVTEDAASSNKDITRFVKQKKQQDDPEVFYQISDIGVEPNVRQKDA